MGVGGGLLFGFVVGGAGTVLFEGGGGGGLRGVCQWGRGGCVAGGGLWALFLSLSLSLFPFLVVGIGGGVFGVIDGDRLLDYYFIFLPFLYFYPYITNLTVLPFGDFLNYHDRNEPLTTSQ